jgi:hypothetical protein
MISLDYYMPNASGYAIRVSVCGIVFYFSYSTVVAYYTHTTGLVASQNVWSRTTGKHLNFICPDQSDRTDYDTFAKGLVEVERRMATAMKQMNNLELMKRLEEAANEKEK